MLSGKTLAVLKAVVELSGGTFKVLDADDIIEKVEGEKPQKLELSGIIKSLAEQGLVKVKTASTETTAYKASPARRLLWRARTKRRFRQRKFRPSRKPYGRKPKKRAGSEPQRWWSLKKLRGLLKEPRFSAR